MKRFRRLIALLLVAVLLVSVLPVQASAAKRTTGADAAIISMNSTSAKPGTEVTVDIEIANNPGILGATLRFAFGSGLTLVRAKAGEAFSALVMTAPGQFTSPCAFTWDGQEIQEEDIHDGVILSLTFEIAEDAAIGEDLPITMSYRNGDIVDGNLQAVPVEIVNGSITVINYIPGDVNDDGIVNSSDVILMRRHIAGGYSQTVNEAASDVNDDGYINSTDVILVRRSIAGGYGVVLLPSHERCGHEMQATAAVAATCTEDGNIAYWYCTLCEKYFAEAYGTTEIALEDTAVEATGHTPVVDEAVPATETSTGLTAGSHCGVCGVVLQAQEVIPVLAAKTHNIIYDVANGDVYLLGLIASGELSNTNPSTFTEKDGLTLRTLSVDGYRFLGWYDGASASNSNKVTRIEKNTTEDVELFAVWEKIPYTVQMQSDLFLETNQLTYTVDTGVSLPTPTLSNYVFTGWVDDTGTLYKSNRIAAGTTGNIVLTANWTSERNKTWTKKDLDEPIIEVDEENDIILFAYEIGEIQNVPLYTIKDFGYISGDGVTKSETATYRTTITEASMQAYAKAVSNATTQSSNWTLSDNWNEITTVDEQWREEIGYTKEEIETIAKSNTDTWNVSSGSSGSTNTTHLETNQDGWEREAKASSSDSHTTDLGVSATLTAESHAGTKLAGVSVSGSITGEISTSDTHSSGLEVGAAKNGSALETDSTVTSSSWNSSSGYGGSKTSSESSSISTAISERICETYGYGQSYASGGESSTTQGLTSMQSASDEYSSSITFSKEISQEVTSSWTTQSTKAGYHRWVVAGTAHVFAVVGYDMTTRSYFVYTYSVMDDETHEFEDYSYTTASYNDQQNGVISFEVPYEVAEYVADLTFYSDGLKVNQETGTITGYTGADNCVVIPEYMNVGGGKVVKITAISPTAFAGNTQIAGVVLSDYITEIPDNAFAGCTSLHGVFGGAITKIGSNAFNGCVSLEECGLHKKVTSLGTNAFAGTGALYVNAANASVAEATVCSGAKRITLHIKDIENGVDSLSHKTFTVPESTEYFELNGYKQTFTNFKLESNAGETVIKEARFIGTDGIPLLLSSPEVSFNDVSTKATGIAMALCAADTNVGLQGTITVESENTNALLSKNLSLYEINPTVDGKLVVKDKLLICGTVNGASYLTYTVLETIDEDTFMNMLNSYTLTFDACGGTCSETSRKVANCTAVGELPTPTRDYYTFTGWYLSDGTTRVTEDTVFSSGVDQTLFAHWTQNPVSDWVKASEAPADAQIVERKYTYTLTSYTTSLKSSLAGWTLYDTTSEWGEYGAWSSWSTTPVTETNSRDVETTSEPYQAHTGYNMIAYNTKSTGGSRQFRNFSINGNYSGYGCSSSYGEISYSMWASDAMINAAPTVAAGKYTNSCTYPGYNKSDTTGYILWYGNESFVFFISGDTYETRYITYYRYRDRSLVYTYYFSKTENLESADLPTGDGVSNVVEWVKYRPKTN